MGKKTLISSKQKLRANSAFESPAYCGASHPAYTFPLSVGALAEQRDAPQSPVDTEHVTSPVGSLLWLTQCAGGVCKRWPTPTNLGGPMLSPTLRVFFHISEAKCAWAGKCLEILRPWIRDEPSGNGSTFSWFEGSEANIQIFTRFPAPQATLITTTALRTSAETHSCAALRCFVALLTWPGHWSLIYLKTFNFFNFFFFAWGSKYTHKNSSG